jgi:hypothetical protein
MDVTDKQYRRGLAMRFLSTALAFIFGLAAHSVWDNRLRISELVNDFIANYQD